MNVRELAAVDMHGLHGSSFRRRLILTEFVAAAVAGIGLGLFVLLASDGWGGKLFSLWVLGVGANYIPLAIHAITFARGPAALEAQLRDVDLLAALRRYTLTQFWVVIPLYLVVCSLAQRPRSRVR